MLDKMKDFLDNILDKVSKSIEGTKSKSNVKKSSKSGNKAGNKAKERLHIVLVQDRANISTDFLELMKQEIIDVIKKYVVVDESKIDVRFTNSINSDGSHAAPTLYANVPILNIRNEMKSQKLSEKELKKQEELEGKVNEALKNEEQFSTMQIVLEGSEKTSQENKNKENNIESENTKKENETLKKEEEKNKKADLKEALKNTAKKQREKNKSKGKKQSKK